VLRARPVDVEDAIRVGGLAKTKSRVIRGVLRAIRRDHGGFDLKVLTRLPVEEAKGYLLGLKGVGDKTACCVLLFACPRSIPTSRGSPAVWAGSPGGRAPRGPTRSWRISSPGGDISRRTST
jgi:hypothetical protein